MTVNKDRTNFSDGDTVLHELFNNVYIFVLCVKLVCMSGVYNIP